MRRVVVLATLLLCACSKMPDASSAQAAYRAQRRTVRSIDRGLRAEVARLPMTRVVRCAEAAEVERRNDPRLHAEFEACWTRRSAWRESSIAAQERFRREYLLSILDAHHRVLGLEVTLQTRGEDARYQATIGTVGWSNHGVDASSGVGAGEYRLGWHLYQTAFAYVPRGRTEYVHSGDGEARAGIELSWTFREGDVTAENRLVLLIEDETDARWRAAQRRARERSD